jgi:transposase InsO family protein
VKYLVRRHKVSERRACRVVGQHRSSQRYVPLPDDFEARLVKEMNRLAELHPRWGYRQIHRLLVEDGWLVNRKRIERLWRREGHKVPPLKSKNSGQKAGGGAENSIWNLPAVYPDHIWSFDFMNDRTSDGIPFRILNIIDEYIGARRVAQVLERLFATVGKPKIIRSDNGREFIAETLAEWLGDQGVISAFVAKGSPTQNGICERFNGTMRRECLNAEEFNDIVEARVVIGAFRLEYNTVRPHRGLGGLTPAAFAAEAARSRPGPPCLDDADDSDGVTEPAKSARGGQPRRRR